MGDELYIDAPVHFSRHRSDGRGRMNVDCVEAAGQLFQERFSYGLRVLTPLLETRGAGRVDLCPRRPWRLHTRARPGVTGALIADQVPLPPQDVIFEPSFSETPRRIAEVAAPGDVILTMGIGNVYLLCPEILAEIAGTIRDD